VGANFNSKEKLSSRYLFIRVGVIKSIYQQNIVAGISKNSPGIIKFCFEGYEGVFV